MSTPLIEAARAWAELYADGSVIDDPAHYEPDDLARMEHRYQAVMALELRDILGSAFVESGIGRHFTCTEADALYQILIAAGCPDSAESLMADHRRGEYPEDDHYDPTISEHAEDES